MDTNSGEMGSKKSGSGGTLAAGKFVRDMSVATPVGAAAILPPE
jgi:hypothetical protein